MFRRNDPAVPASLRESDFGRRVPESELRRVAQMGTSVFFRSGRSVMEEDAVGRECIMVVDGSFEVARDGRFVAELGAGDFAGEVALLNRTPRNATVTATADSSVVVFNRREFASLLAECPTVAQYVRGIAVARQPIAA